MAEKITDRARGRWRDILTGAGLGKHLSGKHGPCPLCGGEDRFRWDDKGGNGSFICSRCGAGSGVDLVMKFLNVDFRGAKAEIEKYVGAARVEAPKAQISDDEQRARMASVWARTFRIADGDPVSKWLRRRGLSQIAWPSIRFLPDAAYTHDDKSKTYHPAMVAKFVAPDGIGYSLHTTFLTEEGDKAAVEKVRRVAAGKIPPGGAVRLASSAETMGIAEGLETAMSAAEIDGVPVWSALNAGNLIKWRPPETARHILIYGDNDASATGQHAAWSLAYRLKGEGYAVEVRIPEFEGDDWNDVLLARCAERRAA